MAALKDGLVKTAVGLGSLSFLVILLTTCLPYWRVSDPVASDPFMSQVKSVEGLWIRCTATVKEYYTCDWYDTAMIGLPAYITGFRALMLVATIASFVGLVTSVLGLGCLHALPDEGRKRQAVVAAGVVHLVAGATTCLCVSWYASEVVREFNNPLYEQTRSISYTFGSCLYLGWIASLLSIITGSLLSLCHLSCGGGDDVRRGKYEPPAAAMATTQRDAAQYRSAYQTTRSPIYTKAPRDVGSRDERSYYGRGRYDERHHSNHDDSRRSAHYPSNDDGYV